jgi:hypothetical protein
MFNHFTDTHKKTRAFLLGALSLTAMCIAIVIFDTQHPSHTQSAQATSTATTTVTVLNTPPTWDVTAREQFASATTTPTNTGTSTRWTATASDSNSEDYYLLICKSSSTPIAAAGGPPSCGGGASDIWAVSGAITSGTAGYAATTTQEGWAEVNDWYAYICDGNSGSPACNDAQYNGLHEAGPASATSSPFVVNHRPYVTLAADDSPTIPGATTTWTTTSDDDDALGGADTIQLHVCKAQDFNAAIPACGVAGFWASSTFTTANATADGFIIAPQQDRDHDAYIYIVDEHGHPASGGWHASSTVLTIQNVAPYVSSSSIQVYDVFGTTTSDQNLNLVTEEGETENFVVEFQVVDLNSCEAFGGGDEITSANLNVFRYNGTDPYTQSLLCDASGEYDANSCYTDTNAFFTPNCYQVPGDCSGPTQSSVTWECTFPMWYIADPTDNGSQFSGHDWRASVRVADEALTSSYSTYNGAVDVAGSANMIQFLSFRATGSPIAYGSHQPGFGTAQHPATTTVFATGNTGLNQYLSGDAMCTNYPSCSGNATSTIYVPYQHYSLTNTTAYAAGTELSTSTSPTLVDVNITKPTATNTPTQDDTFWGIEVPGSITYAGDYIGRNYIDGAVAPSGEW